MSDFRNFFGNSESVHSIHLSTFQVAMLFSKNYKHLVLEVPISWI